MSNLSINIVHNIAHYIARYQEQYWEIFCSILQQYCLYCSILYIYVNICKYLPIWYTNCTGLVCRCASAAAVPGAGLARAAAAYGPAAGPYARAAAWHVTRVTTVTIDTGPLSLSHGARPVTGSESDLDSVGLGRGQSRSVVSHWQGGTVTVTQ